MSRWEKNLAFYDDLVAQCPRFERKGKTVPYTSANGHMFSLLNKEGDFGIRFSKEVQEKYFQEFNTSYLMSHGAKMNGYVMIPDAMFHNKQKLIDLLNEGYDFVMTLPPK